MNLTVHTLGEYLDLLDRRGLLAAPVSGEADRSAPVSLVSYDSREVVPGTVFICKGAHFREEFLRSAREKGAILYVSDRPWPGVDLPGVLVTDLRLAIAPLADLYYGHPSEKLSVIGITGTKGKSSTAYFLKHILDSWEESRGGQETGVVSSIHTYDGVERFESHLTTPEPLDLQRHFANAARSGMEYLTMEVSSQALKYHRSLCTRFAVTCFLNIGYDHISPIEHPDFEDYFASKLKIFAQGAVNCVNLDCDHAQRVLDAARAAGRPVVTFSQKDPAADVYAAAVRKEGDEILFRVRAEGLDREFRLTMPGLFNVENALAAIAVCRVLKVPESAIYAGLLRARVPGRMEVYANGDGTVTAIVDYAHNRLSFETLFRSVKAEYPGRRIVTVFGCPGKKAIDRRRDLGQVAGANSDFVVLTEEDSGEEDTLDICRQVAVHVAGEHCPYAIVPNRGEAIRRAILDCGSTPSLLLITGKGAETRQKRGTEYIDVPSDVDYVHTFLQEYDAVHHVDGDEAARQLARALPVLEAQKGRALAVCWDGETQGNTVLQDAAVLELAGMDITIVRKVPGHCSGRYVDLIPCPAQAGGRPGERMDAAHARHLLDRGVPKGELGRAMERCLAAVSAGAGEAAVLDSREDHALLSLILGKKTGLTVVP